ncbi:hypothetical protein [Mycolicibacterium iranicum]|uniref:hypothetical protein n=1 Tax=Mycolicibacterium iranicum TaxID=912594 RepID=UPI000463E8C3|nr:hypothetical protein [Mycolicibacterium iranicum]
MAKQKVPRPTDIKAIRAAAAEAAEAAQAVATGALRIPPASIKLAAEVPDLIENLAVATERLNVAVDRMERYLALAAPMLRTMDALLPQLEALVATGNEVYRTVASVPGVSTLGRFANRGAQSPDGSKPPKPRTPKRKS